MESASSVNDQRVYGLPNVWGPVRAIRAISARVAGSNLWGRPPADLGDNDENPSRLKLWITPRTRPTPNLRPPPGDDVAGPPPDDLQEPVPFLVGDLPELDRFGHHAPPARQL